MLNEKLTCKRAAMFGLDARIALAIFGALSVISGAALYSAIQNAKATAVLTEMQEIGKAWEQYMLDTGSDLPKETDNGTGKHRVTSALLSSSATGWQGPYISGVEDSSNTDRILNSYGGNWSLVSVSKRDWGLGHATSPTWTVNGCDDSTYPCYTSVQLSTIGANILSLDIAAVIDEQVDGSDGSTQGNFRWYQSNSYNIFALIYAPHKMPV
tara:strand:+ start:3709 stop:4344 length:636 start_codon:yes stop_codon:yes gene_type:complete